MRMELRAMTVPRGAKVFMALKQCLGCESCAPPRPQGAMPLPNIQPVLGPTWVCHVFPHSLCVT